MDTKLFKPSIDWSSAFQDSLRWLAIAWVIGAVCLLAALVAARYLTPWGRQFWRITRGYFVGPTSVKAWLGLGVLLLLVLFSVRLNVLFSYQSNDMYTALQVALKGLATGNEEVKHSGIHNFWVSLGIFILLAAIFIARVILDIYLTQRFIIAWRMWLTGHLTDDWLAGRAYYRDLFIDKTIDNPDQRIQQDIDIFTAGVGGTPNIPSNGTTSTLLFGAVNAVASVISFAAILWNLSGDFNLFGVNVPRAMFWTVLVYVLIVTVVAIWLGRPLIWLSFNNEKLNAAFRYALVRLRDAAEAVGFYRGERVERTQLWRRFTPIIDNYRRYVRRTIIFNGWNWSATQTIIPLPLAIQAPRLFTGEIAFGDVTQTAQAFGNINDSLSFFRNNYDAFAAFRAAIIRLHGLVDANDKGRALPTILVKPSEETAVELRGIEVRTPEGDQLVDSLDIQLDLGDSLVITGRSGAGKTTCCAAWPNCGPTPRERCAVRMATTRRCSCRSCHMCRSARCAPWCVTRIRRTASPMTNCATCSPRLFWRRSSAGWTRSRTGPKCCPPASSSASRLRASCSPGRRRSSSTRRLPRWTAAWNTRCTNWFGRSCRNACS